MKYYYVFLIFTLIGCKSKENLEVEILTKEVNYLDVENYKDYIFGEKDAPIESKTIINYKLTNNTEYPYYFNIHDMGLKNQKDYFIQVDKAFIAFSDKDEKFAEVSWRALENSYNDRVLANLDYNLNHRNNFKNFVIHPHETLYFEYFTILPFGTFLEDKKFTVNLDKRENYVMQIFINSDGIDYEKDIGRADVNTIKENGYKVFNGVIKSKNKIPVVFKSLKN